MKGYVTALNKLNILLKILLALPVLDGIFYGLYRIAKGKVLLGILWFFIGSCIGWVVDIASILLNGKVEWLA